jgi:diketogulonate reductase-like aldo/keto reductase
LDVKDTRRIWAVTLADFIPIPGTEHVEYLKENAEAVKVEISQDDDKRIRKTIEGVGGVEGAHYPEASLSWYFGDSPELGNQRGMSA